MRDRARRYPRRVQVRFWPEDEPEIANAGYSRNISATGIFLQTAHPVRPGRVLVVELQLEETSFQVRGQVVHSAKVSPMLQSVRPSGMGVKFIERCLDLERLLPAEEARQDSQERVIFPLYFPSAQELLETFERDIKNGGLFVPTTRPAEMEDDVTIELHLPRPEDPVLTIQARVVHRIDSGDNPGMGIAFLHQESVIQGLQPVIDSLQEA